MLILDETLILKIGFLGLAEEVVITAPVKIDDELSDEENLANSQAAMLQVMEGLQKEMFKPFAKFLMTRMGMPEEDITEADIQEFLDSGDDDSV